MTIQKQIDELLEIRTKKLNRIKDFFIENERYFNSEDMEYLDFRFNDLILDIQELKELQNKIENLSESYEE